METVSFKPSEEFTNTAGRVFKEQKQRILDQIPYVEVHHVGGTAIPNLITKGDLDVNVRVEKNNFNSAVEVLRQMYEINQLDNWTENYASFKDDKNLGIDLGVQLTVIGSSDDYFLSQRDILLTNMNLVKELNDIKARYEGKSMDEYRKEKGQFFERITNKIL